MRGTTYVVNEDQLERWHSEDMATCRWWGVRTAFSFTILVGLLAYAAYRGNFDALWYTCGTLSAFAGGALLGCLLTLVYPQYVDIQRMRNMTPLHQKAYDAAVFMRNTANLLIIRGVESVTATEDPAGNRTMRFKFFTDRDVVSEVWEADKL